MRPNQELQLCVRVDLGVMPMKGVLHILQFQDWSFTIIFGLVGFYGISTIVGYLMPNPLYTYILIIYDLVWLGFMAYQPLLVI